MRPDQIAWAAGLFDAEGSACSYGRRDRPSRQRQMFVYQAGKDLTPEVLLRFRNAVGGRGSITGPYRGRLYHWSTKRHSAFDEVAAGLWPWLGAAKRAQLRDATTGISRELPQTCEAGLRVVRSRDRDDLAWASGFFVGEGYVGTWRSGRSRTIAMSLAQASDGEVPDTLVRFRDTVGVGAIRGPRLPSNPWSKLPQYEWRTQSFQGVQAVIALLWPWLDERKKVRSCLAIRHYLRRDATVATSMVVGSAR